MANMFSFDFSTELPIKSEQLFNILTDYSKLQELVPDQVKECRVLESSNDETITYELLTFRTYLKAQTISQKTSHRVESRNTLLNTIIEGPFKGSTLRIILEDKNAVTKVILNANCKIPLKYTVLTPVIKKYYKNFCLSILYKINNRYNLN